MRPHSLGFIFVLGLLLASCGGAAAPNPAEISLSIAPAVISVAQGSTLALTGNATGFTATPVVGWWMQEANGTPGGKYCGLDTNDQPPTLAECPIGYITYNTKTTGVPSAATYHAPPTPGTYHPVFQASQWDGYKLEVSKSTTAEITVTP